MSDDYSPGDMPRDEFRQRGHDLIEWIADYLSRLEQYPVLSTVKPGEVRGSLPPSLPEDPQDMEDIFADFEDRILPGVTHWNHPSFFAYFSISASGPGILGELLIAALNVNGMLWKSSPSATELEELTLDWLRQLLHLPDTFRGIIYDTASVSTLHALAAGREKVAPEIRQDGMSGLSKPLRVYCSDQAHSSVDKAALALGFGQSNLVKIQSDPQFRLDALELEKSLLADVRNGLRPCCVVATVGTTSTTSVDPILEIAALCKEYGTWLHIDSAYAGISGIVEGMEWVLEGWKEADSIVVNPHKWLFTPLDLSVLYFRRSEILKRAFSLVPEYLETTDRDVLNFMDYGIPLGRRFRALKLWMVMRYFGARGLRTRISQHIKWAGELAQWVEASPAFELLAPVRFSTVCFRAKPEGLGQRELNGFNARLLESLNNTGKVFLSNTVLNQRYALRLAIGNLKTERRHIVAAWKLIQRVASDLASDLSPEG